ncbi:MAG: PorV/PorQ family protein [Bacteroidia bacterium]
MKKSYKFLTPALLIGLAALMPTNLFAGNPDRAGTAGATELLINPWARSSGWAGANTAMCQGIEASYLNIAGLAFTPQTELIFDHTNWLVGTGIGINTFGLSQRVGKTGVIGFNVMSMDFGNIMITTTDNPEGGLGTFSPSFVNLGMSYAKAFSDNIYGGINMKVISEAISNVSAKGVAVDAGVQYVTGPTNNIHFGISLKNVGPTMVFRGDGLSFRTALPNGNPFNMTVEQRSQEFELPSLVNIGAGYDINFSKDSSALKTQRLTIAANFTSNSFSQDQYQLGLEYGFRSYLMLRVGFCYENGIFDAIDAGRLTAYTGPTAGFTVQLPFGHAKKSTFSIDYSYRASDPFQGTNTIGARISL